MASAQNIKILLVFYRYLHPYQSEAFRTYETVDFTIFWGNMPTEHPYPKSSLYGPVPHPSFGKKLV
jgi:hypothetical protein